MVVLRMMACEGVQGHEDVRGNRGKVRLLMGDFGCCASEVYRNGVGWNEILELI